MTETKKEVDVFIFHFLHLIASDLLFLNISQSAVWLSDFTFTFHFPALEKEMATHSSVVAWRIPGTGEPGGLPSLGSYRVGHDWSALAAAQSPEKQLPTTSFAPELILYYTEISIMFCMFNKLYFLIIEIFTKILI